MRRFLVVSGRRALAGLAAATVLSLASCTKIEARDLIREGNDLYKKGEYVEAIARYDEAEQLEPDGVTLFWNRACAAEARVLSLKKDEEAEERKKYADIALKNYQTWFDRLEQKSEEQSDLLLKRRLAILQADNRCDDLLQYWLDRHREQPKEENLYGKLASMYEQCNRPDEAMKWMVKRTEDFPESVQSWYALATKKYEPLYADPQTQLPYNENLPPAERLRIADEVISLLDKATGLDPKFRDAYVWRSMAFTQRQYARTVVEKPEISEEKLEALLAREDTMLAWKNRKAVCDLDKLPECPGATPDTPCCEGPPLTPEEQAADAEQKKVLLTEIEAAEAAVREQGKKRKKKR